MPHKEQGQSLSASLSELPLVVITSFSFPLTLALEQLKFKLILFWCPDFAFGLFLIRLFLVFFSLVLLVSPLFVRSIS